MASPLSAKYIHKVYRLHLAIKEMEKEVKIHPTRQPALEELRRLLTAYQHET